MTVISHYIIVLQAFDFTNTGNRQIKVKLQKICNLGRLNKQVVATNTKKSSDEKKKTQKDLFSGCC